MATIWKEVRGEFRPQQLPSADEKAMSADVADAQIVPFPDGHGAGHALVVHRETWASANGQAVIGGLHVLQHKDELLIAGERMFYSAESTPVIEIYSHDGAQRRPRCPVCRSEIQDGDAIVRCPGCSRIHHQSQATDGKPETPCWTYAPTCRFCQHPTSLSGEPSWRPDQEEL